MNHESAANNFDSLRQRHLDELLFADASGGEVQPCHVGLRWLLQLPATRGPHLYDFLRLKMTISQQSAEECLLDRDSSRRSNDAGLP